MPWQKPWKMVKLGFISEISQCPPQHPGVCLGTCDEAAGAEPSPTIRAWTERRTQRYELRWDVPADPARLGDWTPAMAASLNGLVLPGWWLDPASVGRALQLPVEEALIRWGMAFWPHYRATAAVYIFVGDVGRGPAYHGVRAWERRFEHVRFHSRYDLDLAARQAPAKINPVAATLSRCLPGKDRSQGKFNVASWLRARKN